MNDNRLSPVLIPTATVHAGLLGFVSFLAIVTKFDPLLSRIGMVGVAFSVFLMVAGLIAIILYRNQLESYDEAKSALNAMTVFLLPIFVYVILQPVILRYYSYKFVLISLTPFLLQIVFFCTSNYYVQFYCQILKYDKPKTVKWLLFVYFFFVNTGAFLTVRQLYWYTQFD